MNNEPPHRATLEQIAKDWLPDPGNDDDLLRRGDITAMLRRLADTSADYAIHGEPDNARAREAAEAAYTQARCAVALLAPDPGWRPISEAPLGVTVLVFHMQHGYRVAACHLMFGGERNWTWGPGDEPIAWRPLPPPPAGEAE